MPYIGKQPTVGNFQVCDAISVVNGQAAYTMLVGGSNEEPENANHMLVSLNGVLQKPGSSFTISGSTITFASNLATGDVIDFITLLGDTLNTGTPSDDTVTAAKLNNDIISGQTALTAEPDDTDEFLVSDAGTIKRIDYSLIKGGGRYALISTGTISGGATYIDLDDVFSSSYKNYLLVATGIDVNTDGADLHIQVKTSGGLVSGGSDYLYSYLQRASNTDSHSGSYSTGASYFRLNSSGVGNLATESANLYIQFYNVRSTSHHKLIFSQMTSMSTGSDALYNLGVGAVKTTTALTGVRLKSSTGNLDAGVLKLYGAND